MCLRKSGKLHDFLAREPELCVTGLHAPDLRVSAFVDRKAYRVEYIGPHFEYIQAFCTFLVFGAYWYSVWSTAQPNEACICRFVNRSHPRDLVVLLIGAGLVDAQRIYSEPVAPAVLMNSSHRGSHVVRDRERSFDGSSNIYVDSAVLRLPTIGQGGLSWSTTQ